MEAFLLDKFRFDVVANERFIAAIDTADLLLNSEIRAHMCHILNVHHLWINRLLDKPTISEDWDDLPVYAWSKLNQENFQMTEEFIRNENLEGVCNYQTSEGNQMQKGVSSILYHLLQHATHHRAVINMLFRKYNADPVVFNYIEEA